MITTHHHHHFEFVFICDRGISLLSTNTMSSYYNTNKYHPRLALCNVARKSNKIIYKIYIFRSIY